MQHVSVWIAAALRLIVLCIVKCAESVISLSICCTAPESSAGCHLPILRNICMYVNINTIKDIVNILNGLLSVGKAWNRVGLTPHLVSTTISNYVGYIWMFL